MTRKFVFMWFSIGVFALILYANPCHAFKERPLEEAARIPCKKLIDDAYKAGKIDIDTWASYRLFKDDVPQEYWVTVPSGAYLHGGGECTPAFDDVLKENQEIIFNHWNQIPETKKRLIKRKRDKSVGSSVLPMILKIHEPDDKLVTRSRKVKISGALSALEVEDPIVGEISIRRPDVKSDDEMEKITDIHLKDKKYNKSERPNSLRERYKDKPDLLEYLGDPGRNQYRFSENVELKNYGKNELMILFKGQGQKQVAWLTIHYFDDSDKEPPSVDILNPIEGEEVDKQKINVKVTAKDNKGILAIANYFDGKLIGGLGFSYENGKVNFVRDNPFDYASVKEPQTEESREYVMDLANTLARLKKSYERMKNGRQENQLPANFSPENEVDISPGAHKLRIEAKDIGGNISFKEISIILK